MFVHAKQAPTSSQWCAFMSCLSSPQLTGLSRLWLTPLEAGSTVQARSHCKSLSLSPCQRPQGTLRTCPQTLKDSQHFIHLSVTCIQELSGRSINSFPFPQRLWDVRKWNATRIRVKYSVELSQLRVHEVKSYFIRDLWQNKPETLLILAWQLGWRTFVSSFPHSSHDNPRPMVPKALLFGKRCERAVDSLCLLSTPHRSIGGRLPNPRVPSWHNFTFVIAFLLYFS